MKSADILRIFGLGLVLGFLVAQLVPFTLSFNSKDEPSIAYSPDRAA